MAESVYVLCALTSALCAILLWNGYRRSHTRLLFWSALCFAGLTVNNVLLFLDLVVITEVDLSIARSAAALAALLVLLYGLVWEAR